MHSKFCLNTTNHTVILSVTQLSNLVRLEQIEGASIRIIVNSDAKDSCDTAEIFELEVLMKSLLEMLNVVEVSKKNQVINEFGGTDCKPLSSLLPAGCNLYIIKTTPPSSVKLPYCHIIGALLWIALASGPDILFATIYLTCFLCG